MASVALSCFFMRDSVTPFEWNSSRVENSLKSLEMKTDATVSFTTTLLVHRIQFLPPAAEDGEDWKGLKLKKLPHNFNLGHDGYTLFFFI